MCLLLWFKTADLKLFEIQGLPLSTTTYEASHLQLYTTIKYKNYLFLLGFNLFYAHLSYFKSCQVNLRTLGRLLKPLVEKQKTENKNMTNSNSNGWTTYGIEDTMKQTIDSRPRITLAMSLASWAHSPSPTQIHSDPFGHRELKFWVLSLKTPSDITGSITGMTYVKNELTSFKPWRLKVFQCNVT